MDAKGRMSVSLSVAVVLWTLPGTREVDEPLAELTLQSHQPAQIIVVHAEAGSAPLGSAAESMNRCERISVVGGVAAAWARGAAAADTDVIAFIPNWARPEREWLAGLLEAYLDPKLGSAGGAVRTGEPNEQNRGIGQTGLLLPSGYPLGYFAADPGRPVDTDFLAPENFTVRQSALTAIGGIPTGYPGTLTVEHIELGLRLRASGFTVRFDPKVAVWPDSQFLTDDRYLNARNLLVLVARREGRNSPSVRVCVRSQLRHAALAVGRGVTVLRTSKDFGRAIAVTAAQVPPATATIAGIAAGLMAPLSRRF